jgi:hypothetical protein
MIDRCSTMLSSIWLGHQLHADSVVAKANGPPERLGGDILRKNLKGNPRRWRPNRPAEYRERCATDTLPALLSLHEELPQHDLGAVVAKQSVSDRKIRLKKDGLVLTRAKPARHSEIQICEGHASISMTLVFEEARVHLGEQTRFSDRGFRPAQHFAFSG